MTAGAQSLAFVDERFVPIPEQAKVEAHRQVQARRRVGAVTNQVAEADDLLDLQRLHVSEDRFQGLEIGVNVANDRSSYVHGARVGMALPCVV